MQPKQIWIESIVRDDPNDRGQNLLFVITFSVTENGVTKRYRKKSCGVIASADLYHYSDSDFVYVGFECVNLDENTEQI